MTMSSSTANDTAAAGETRAALGTLGWPDARCIHMGDITELGAIVAGAFAHPDEAGNGEYLPLVGDFMSFNEIIDTLNRQGHKFSFKQVPKEVFATLFPGAAEIADLCLFPSSYLLGCEFGRRNCARKQNSREATERVRDVGPSEFCCHGHRRGMIADKGRPPREARAGLSRRAPTLITGKSRRLRGRRARTGRIARSLAIPRPARTVVPVGSG